MCVRARVRARKRDRPSVKQNDPTERERKDGGRSDNERGKYVWWVVRERESKNARERQKKCAFDRSELME